MSPTKTSVCTPVNGSACTLTMIAPVVGFLSHLLESREPSEFVRNVGLLFASSLTLPSAFLT